MGNCLKNGLLPIIVDDATHADLFKAANADESAEVEIDLEKQTLKTPSGREVTFPIDEFSKKCLLAGVDQLRYIQQQAPHIAGYEQSHAARVNTL